MRKKFNLTGYQELLEMQNRGEIVFMDENYFKLLRYQTSVRKQLTYDRKEDYYLIIKKYLNKLLTLDKFLTQFLNMHDQDIEKSSVILGNIQELKEFYLVEDLEEFSTLIGEICDLCEDYYTLTPMPKTTFYSLVKKYYNSLQKSFPVKN